MERIERGGSCRDSLEDPNPTEGAAHITAGYYTFSNYVSKTRMLTFWYQISEVLEGAPKSVLEVGVGPRVVAGTLRELGVDLTTFDLNPQLDPDMVGSVLDLEEIVGPDSFDTVLCARVLHHLPLEDFRGALSQLASVARHTVVLTLPVDEARLYFAARRTASQYWVGSVQIPRAFKALGLRVFGSGECRYRQLWKVGGEQETSMEAVIQAMAQYFRVVRSYAIPEDRSHAVFVLQPLGQ